MLRIALFIIGLTLSGVAAFYSVTGLAYIFVSAFWPVIIMGGTLEAAKLVAASWVFRYWRQAPKFLIGYLSVGVVLLMLITDIGIFGYLSRSYLTQQAPLTLLSSSRAGAQRDATLARQQYARDDAALTAFVSAKTTSAVIEKLTSVERLTGSNGAVSVLRSQQAIQKELQTNLKVSSAALSVAEGRLADTEQQTQIQRVDVGPLLFVAKAWYGADDMTTMDTVATTFILLILVVFDPMAIALLLAAQTTLRTGDANVSNEAPRDVPHRESQQVAYIPEDDSLPTAEDFEPPRVSTNHENPVVGIAAEDITSDMRIGVPIHHAFKSATIHTREAEDAPILATDTDTETLGNRDLEDMTFTIDRPKSGNRRTRLGPKR
jgi:hypothetical protein